MSGHRSSVFIAAPTAWTPASESDLAVWISAQGTAYSNGDPVTSLTDMSTHGLTVTGSGGSKPTFTTNVIGSKPGILFNGSNNYMTIASLQTTRDICVCMVMQCKNSVGLIIEQPDNINNGDGIAFYGGTGYSFNSKRSGTISQSDYNGNFGGQNADAKLVWNYDNSLGSSGSSQTSFSGNTKFNYQTGYGTQFGTNGTVNSVDRQNSLGTQTVTATCYLMSRGGASLFTNAYLYEFFVFNSAKDATFFDTVNNYVFNKWGI